jgi:hypothetical protein
MSNIQREEKFKRVMEIFFYKAECYDNILSFIEGEIENDFTLDFAQDFTEELEKYLNNIEETFNEQIINIDAETLNYNIFNPTFFNIKNALDTIKKLTASEFEKLCALYLKFLGCSKVNATKHSHDQGIDFVGIILPEETPRIYSKNFNISQTFIIGQAKHYDVAPVHVNEIRELAGSLYLLRSRSFAALNNPYEHLNIKAFSPIYAYFITSNYFTHIAKRLCINSDIMPVDRILLAITFGLIDDYKDDNRVFNSYKLINAIGEIEIIY